MQHTGWYSKSFDAPYDNAAHMRSKLHLFCQHPTLLVHLNPGLLDSSSQLVDSRIGKFSHRILYILASIQDFQNALEIG